MYCRHHNNCGQGDKCSENILREHNFVVGVEDSNNPGKKPFTNRSLYHIISTIRADEFRSRIKLFPTITKSLTLSGKQIRNTPSLLSTSQDLISRRQTEIISCSLCFNGFRKTSLHAACGRRGCAQTICRPCLLSWYGINAAGRVIDTAALSCPFCRRLPAAGTLNKYGMSIHAVASLATAVAEKGSWTYAWCGDCSTARRFEERVCAQGIPADVTDWSCETCEQARNGKRDRKAAKPCPGCGVMTKMIYGCDHITCTVAGCRQHWCYACGKGFAASIIYLHMSEEHMALYDNELYMEMENEEDEPDDENELWLE